MQLRNLPVAAVHGRHMYTLTCLIDLLYEAVRVEDL
jgi:hypothetical protein